MQDQRNIACLSIYASLWEARSSYFYLNRDRYQLIEMRERLITYKTSSNEPGVGIDGGGGLYATLKRLRGARLGSAGFLPDPGLKAPGFYLPLLKRVKVFFQRRRVLSRRRLVFHKDHIW